MIHLDDPAYVRSMERSRALVHLIGHVLLYMFINTALVLVDLMDGAAGSSVLGLNWAYWPILGWGALLALHAGIVFFSVRHLRRAEEQLERSHTDAGHRPLERV